MVAADAGGVSVALWSSGEEIDTNGGVYINLISIIIIMKWKIRLNI